MGSFEEPGNALPPAPVGVKDSGDLALKFTFLRGGGGAKGGLFLSDCSGETLLWRRLNAAPKSCIGCDIWTIPGWAG
jgi:hypothetical protein